MLQWLPERDRGTPGALDVSQDPLIKFKKCQRHISGNKQLNCELLHAGKRGERESEMSAGWEGTGFSAGSVYL